MQTGGNIVDELERNPSHHRQMLYNNKFGGASIQMAYRGTCVQSPVEAPDTHKASWYGKID